MGNYTLAIHNEIESTRSAWFYQPVHNVFLLIFTELGVAGVLVILLFGYFIRRIFNCNLLPIFILFLLLALFDHYLWSLYSGLLLVGVGSGLSDYFFSRNELSTTEIEEKAMAADASIGFNNMPNIGYSAPAATGIKATL